MAPLSQKTLALIDRQEHGQGIADPGPHLQGRGGAGGLEAEPRRAISRCSRPIRSAAGRAFSAPRRRKATARRRRASTPSRPAQMNPNSNYYLAFNTGYPNAFDRAWGRTGSELMVHGDCSSRGCYAMTDEQIQEIYALARESFFGGQSEFQFEAFPFRMTALNMAKHRNNPNFAFWKMLKEGYDHFEATRQEPKVAVCEKRYVFDATPANGATAAAALQRQRQVPGLPARPGRCRRRARLSPARAGQDGELYRQSCGDRCAACRRRRHEPGLCDRAVGSRRRQQRPLLGCQPQRRAQPGVARTRRAAACAQSARHHDPEGRQAGGDRRACEPAAA